MRLTKIGPKHEVTIPKDVFEELRLAAGDYVDVRVKGTTIMMVPAKLVPMDQAWFHTPEWQAKEREADEAIKKGKVAGPFASANQLFRQLSKRTKRRT